jgi:hypothetical protein
MARSSTYIRLRPGDVFPVREYPTDDFGTAHVYVDLVDTDVADVLLEAADPAALDSLITALVEARDWLTAERAGQAPLPTEPDPAPTGPASPNPHLTPGPLPVGVP